MKHSLKLYLKDISEAHEVFYKTIKGYHILACFLKEKQKHKWHKLCEQDKNRGIPIIVEEERWDANRGIPKLRCLSILEIFTWGALDITKLELLPLFILLVLIAPRSSNTSSTQNFNKNFVTTVSVIKQITTFRYCCKLIRIVLYLLY